MNNVENQSNKVDSLIELTIQATDPNGLSLKYTAENLPEGLSIDPLSGLISGIVFEESNNAVTIKVDNGELNSSINFNWQITADPWESINVIGNRLFALVKHNKDLHTRHFQGRRWNQRWLNKKSISGYLSRARYDCLRGRPKKAISKLENLLRRLDQKMLAGPERKLLKQKVHEEIPHLTALINEKF